MTIISDSVTPRYVAIVGIVLIMTTLVAGFPGSYAISLNDPELSENLEIRTWHDLNAVRNNLSGNHTLMNDLNSNTSGYDELAGPTANGGEGWEPIGYSTPAPASCKANQPIQHGLTGTLDGQGYEIRDLFINRPDESAAGLIGYLNEGGIIKNVVVVNVTVIGYNGVGSLVGYKSGIIENVGVVNATVIGKDRVGGLVGHNDGTVINSYSAGIVTGGTRVGGLAGLNCGPVSDFNFTGTVNGDSSVGGLVGENMETVSNSYSSGSVTGNDSVGGLVGKNEGTVYNSHFTGNVTGYEFVGGLVGYNNEGTVSNSYSIGSVIGYARVGGLVGENACSVSNSYSTSNVTGDVSVGGLVGQNLGHVSNSYSSSSVTGDSWVGGLVGYNYATASNVGGTVGYSYSTSNVSGENYVGGLVGWNHADDAVSSSLWDTQTSGQLTSDGGTGKNTTAMQDISTFSGAGWYIITVTNPDMRNPAYTWNIVNNVTYPFLGWQS
jgi:hypothetical protein